MPNVTAKFYVTATRLPQDGRCKWETMRVFATDNLMDALLVYGIIVGLHRMRSVALTRADVDGRLHTLRTYRAPLSDPNHWQSPEGDFEHIDVHQGTARNWHAKFGRDGYQEIHAWAMKQMPDLRRMLIESAIDPGTIAASVPAVDDGVLPEGHGAHT